MVTFKAMVLDELIGYATPVPPPLTPDSSNRGILILIKTIRTKQEDCLSIEYVNADRHPFHAELAMDAINASPSKTIYAHRR
jgi:hypothetical protein